MLTHSSRIPKDASSGSRTEKTPGTGDGGLVVGPDGVHRRLDDVREQLLL